MIVMKLKLWSMTSSVANPETRNHSVLPKMNYILIIAISHFAFTLCAENNSKVNLTHSKVWGPGLQPHIFVMPARYFFIQLTKAEQKSINISLKEDLKIDILGKFDAQRQCRIWINILDRKDGLYIIRYKLYEACLDLEIHIKYQNKHLASSPYVTRNIVYSEDCNCPNQNINKWLESWKCHQSKQITTDLELFPSIDWNLIRDKLIKEYDNPGGISLCNYVIKNNVIYRKCYGKYVGFKMFMDNMLSSIIRKVHLPDLEFFINLGDWPLVKGSSMFPIFSWCGSTDTFDIILPTYDLCESTLENMGRVMLDMLSVQGNVQDVWKTRIPKAFWRGRDSNFQRLKLVNISRKHQDLFNVSLTNFFFYRNEIELYGPKADHVSFFDFFNYKYQISLDGTVAAYRFPYLLAGGSLVFKQNSKYYEHFYNELQPGVHYLPVSAGLEDLVKQLNWAINNDGTAKAIARAGQQFAVENLLPANIFCYYVTLLNEFSKRIKSDIQILPEMEEVKTQSNKCICMHNTKEEL